MAAANLIGSSTITVSGKNYMLVGEALVNKSGINKFSVIDYYLNHSSTLSADQNKNIQSIVDECLYGLGSLTVADFSDQSITLMDHIVDSFAQAKKKVFDKGTFL